MSQHASAISPFSVPRRQRRGNRRLGMIHHVRVEARVGAMWRRRIVVLKNEQLAAVFERGQLPTYHGGDRLGHTVEAAIRCPKSLANGLPVGAVIAQPVPQGFSLTCRVESHLRRP